MFLIYFLAFFDLVAGVLLLARPIYLPLRLFLGHALYLMLKGRIFKGDLFSFIDFLIGIYCLIALFMPITLFNILAGAYLFIKGTISFIA